MHMYKCSLKTPETHSRLDSHREDTVLSDYETRSRIDNGFKHMRFNIVPGQEFMLRTNLESEKFRSTFTQLH